MSLEKKIQRQVDERVHKAVERMSKMYVDDMTTLINAMGKALRSEKFGDIRINRVIANMNLELPEHLRMGECK